MKNIVMWFLVILLAALIGSGMAVSSTEAQSSNFNWTSMCYGSLIVFDDGNEFDIRCHEGGHDFVIFGGSEENYVPIVIR